MSFEDMVAADLEACYSTAGFSMTIEHIFAGESEQLAVIFDEFTEVVLDDSSHTGVAVTVPSFSVPAHLAANINLKSSFIINGKTYAPTEKPLQKDGTKTIYLEVQDA
ncbi:MAG TPA: hypothetical protein CFH81_00395 [Sulfurovum sp. UBA12169]|nr:MAG TPA: hypothetical protein CFH81_00395 [Sulfurovum sp. UBA12169]